MTAITLPAASSSGEYRERLFFFVMAAFVAVVIASGFLSRIATGAITFAQPWPTHVHAVSFMSWLGVFVAQSGLALRGSMALHATLGRAGVALAAWMTVVGVAVTANAVASGCVPPFFTPPYFLMLDWLNAGLFLGLVLWAVRMRRRSDWHRRLMLCATVYVGIPGFARLILLVSPAPDVFKLLGAYLAFLAPAIAFDLVTRRRIHPAYLAASGIVIITALLVGPVSRLAPVAALAERIGS
jgi:hypothetical protein